MEEGEAYMWAEAMWLEEVVAQAGEVPQAWSSSQQGAVGVAQVDMALHDR